MKNKNLKLGMFSTVISIIVIVCAVLINFLVLKIPSTYTEFDTSEQQLLNLSDDTEEFVSKLTDSITLYYVVQSGQEDDRIDKLLKRYSELTDKIKYVKHDPVLHPSLTTVSGTEYNDDNLAGGNIIASSSIRDEIVTVYDIYYPGYSEEELYQYYSNSGSLPESTDFAGESCITSSIEKVSLTNLPVLYTLSGHNEYDLGSAVKEYLETDNYQLESLQLITDGGVPSDAVAIMIYMPENDITDEELVMLNDYANAGGNIIFVSNFDFDAEKQPNLLTLAESYGLTTQKGILLDPERCYQAQYYLLPNVTVHEITSTINNEYVFTYGANAISVMDELDDSLDVTRLLTSSDNAYIKQSIESTLEKESGDVTGSYSVAALSVKMISDSIKSNFIWLSGAMLEDNYVQAFPANSEILLNTMKYFTPDKETSVSIATKTTESQTLQTTESTSNIWGVVLIAMIPLTILAIGFVVKNNRKNRT